MGLPRGVVLPSILRVHSRKAYSPVLVRLERGSQMTASTPSITSFRVAQKSSCS